ncbi:RNA-binding protein [Jeotgalibacillus sp. S-D1]|uniref:YlmH family RNA-binding protein n=1 Tax=Jeotgalibacillus sp. S-D1 TaxID=2552189 RepID=UPI00105A6529|nr:RNA-binding protein [Jeotgalibacillus sp. S-D1]TDL35108.1 RNA-binding protein [Jeotgalibacillus sp. S-D1]
MSSLYQHFRKEEQGFIDQVLNWKRDVESKYAPRLTDFLDPRQMFILSSIIGASDDVRIAFEGGPESERKRGLLYPSYLEPDIEDFDLALLEVNYPSKFITVEHKHVLGSLMGLGIKREKIGDIIVSNEIIQIVVAKELSSFFTLNFNQIGNASVSVSEISWEKHVPSNEKWKDRFVTLSSLRLDVVVAGAMAISRQKAQLLIKASKVKVNFKAEEQTSFECAEGDMVSVRGFGRFRVGEIDGKTKKDKWRMTLYLLG